MREALLNACRLLADHGQQHGKHTGIGKGAFYLILHCSIAGVRAYFLVALVGLIYLDILERTLDKESPYPRKDIDVSTRRHNTDRIEWIT